MKLAMMARNPKLYSHQRLVEAAEAAGHQIDIINTTKVYVNITSHNPELRYKGKSSKGMTRSFRELALLSRFMV